MVEPILIRGIDEPGSVSKEQVNAEESARASVGSWMSGTTQRGQWPGEHLGLPESGPGSLGRLGRRIGALWIDWLVAQIGRAACRERGWVGGDAEGGED